MEERWLLEKRGIRLNVCVHKSTVNDEERDKFIDKEKCDRCQKSAYFRYYCEDCSKNYCSNCTIEEAYFENFNLISDVRIGCNDLHKETVGHGDSNIGIDKTLDDGMEIVDLSKNVFWTFIK